MRLTSCILVEGISSEEREKLKLCLDTTKSVLAMTKSMPTLNYSTATDAERMFIFGTEDELAITRQSLAAVLGVLPTEDANPFEPAPVILGVDVHEENNSGAWTEQQIEHLEEDSATATNAAQQVIDAMNRNTAVFFNSGGVTLEDSRKMVAIKLRNLSEEINESLVSPDIRVEWQTQFDRLNLLPTPTESSTGTVTLAHQIYYSENHNPMHWNLVKVNYPNNRYYLTYLCPPCVDMETQLRIVGGIHANDRPIIKEICVYNTEPYWRELRHMMHREVRFLREAVAA